jgi:adenine-specific DNA-methyltransferase
VTADALLAAITPRPSRGRAIDSAPGGRAGQLCPHATEDDCVCLLAFAFYNYQPTDSKAKTMMQKGSLLSLNNVVLLPQNYRYDVQCRDNIDYMRELERESFHLIITSPPYNLGKKYEKKTTLERYVEEQASTIAEAVRLLHPRGSICWQVGNHVDDGEIFPLDVILYPLFKNHGLKLRNRIVWSFGHGLHCQNRFSGRHETILWFTKSDDYIFNLDPVRIPSKYPNKKYYKGPNKGKVSSHPLGKNPSDVWDIPNVKANHVEKTIHPCQFPVGLVERLVLALTNPGQNVLDPYLGVGSSAIAALMHGRNAFGCDIMPEYIEIAKGRVRSLIEGGLRVRPMNRPIYEPVPGRLARG